MNKPQEILAAFVHGVLAFGHTLGVMHNVQKRNPKQAVLHCGVAIYDCWAVWQHIKDLRRQL